ncbi:MAG: biotin--[acetyl-CoA-carboxylase] ligase [Alphaproteobacteria bacterium]|nr:biotin--[acetyl-CoA-carboxylase] ligase [Alphaproteobacteria bacterium]
MGLYKVVSFDKIPSTQSMAQDMIATHKAGDHTVIVAAAQSDGRGRFRRKWVSHHGNLYASFIYACPERDARLSYAVAVAVADTLYSFGITPTIKWPNDILVDGKKISGILIEYCGRFVIVGIGINITTCPTVAEYKTTKTDNYVKINPNDLLGKLMKFLDKWIVADFSQVRARWMSMATGLNMPVKYRGATAQLIGINENGALVLRCGSRYVLAYGDEIVI